MPPASSNLFRPWNVSLRFSSIVALGGIVCVDKWFSHVLALFADIDARGSLIADPLLLMLSWYSDRIFKVTSSNSCRSGSIIHTEVLTSGAQVCPLVPHCQKSAQDSKSADREQLDLLML